MNILRRATGRYKLNYTRFFLTFAMLAAVTAVGEILIKRATGEVGQAAVSVDTAAIVRFLLVMAALTGAKLVFGSLSAYLAKRYAGKADYILRRDFVRHFAAIPFKAHSAKNGGEMLSVYTNDLPRTVALLSTDMADLITEALTMAASLVFMLILRPVDTVIFVAMFPPLILVQILVSKPIQPLMIDASEKKARFNAIVNDSLQNTATVVAYGLEDTMEARYLKSYDQYFAAARKRISLYVRLIISGLLASFIPMMFIITSSALAVAGKTLSVGGFLAYITISEFASSWLTMLAQRLNWLRTNAAGARRLEDQLGDSPESGGGGEVQPASLEGDLAVSLERVDFSYNEGAKVLSDLSLAVKTGENIAIVGPSGCGKSTVLKLMLSLYEADAGSVRVFGRETRGVSKDALRRLVSYVPQDNFMFPESIRENITCAGTAGDLSPSERDERLRKAAREAGILEFIAGLPQGFDTALAEAGDNVSGGQKQRIAIARALYRDAPVILLDEATSALDPITEKNVLDALYENEKNKTTVVVTHRLAAVSGCDRILMMEKGKILEEGRFDELMARRGAFAALYEKQSREASL